MSQKVITNVDYEYAFLSGNVSDIKVTSGYVPDAADYEKLRKQTEELQNKVEILEGEISCLKDFIQDYSHRLEDICCGAFQHMEEILGENQKRMAELLNS